MNHILAFISAMSDAGMAPADPSKITADGQWHDYQIATDPRGKVKGYYVLNDEGQFATGRFGDRRTGGETLPWFSKSSRKFTEEEKIAWAKARDEARLKAEADKELEHREAQIEAKRMWREAVASSADHPYLIRKQISGDGFKQQGDLLLMAIWADDGQIWNVQTISADGDKMFLKGGRKKGCYFPISGSDPDDKSVILVCEGGSTGKSISAATGLPVIVAVDAGNLVHVCKVIRDKYPEAKIVVPSDSDQWTIIARHKPTGIDTGTMKGDDPLWDQWRDNGWLMNTGLDKARQAAGAVGGFITIPPIPANDLDRRTDYNDLAVTEGLEVVKNSIMAVVTPALETVAMVVTPDDQYDGSYPDPDIGVQTFGGDSYIPEIHVSYTKPAFKNDMGMNFRILGYNDSLIYYLPFSSNQIIALTPAGHTMPNLLMLDSLYNWEDKFSYMGKSEDGQEVKKTVSNTKMALMALNEAINISRKRGVFLEEDRVRGAGAWFDKGRIIVNAGNCLYMGRNKLDFKEVDSEYTYVASTKIVDPNVESLGNIDARKLRELCEMLEWENKLSGSLLAGWLVIAPICGALDFRPHIYITGESDAGKSTVMDDIIKMVMGKISYNAGGGTTEPAIRDGMKYDARPLIYDEAEPHPTMPGVIELARKSSTGLTIKKYGQRAFKARFAACFASINLSIDKTADENRIVIMSLKKNNRPTAAQEFVAIEKLIAELLTTDFSDRLFARTLSNLDTLRANIKVFHSAARDILKAARASKVVGTLLAGLYLLGRTDQITYDQAVDWLKKHDWSNHTIINQDGDPVRLVQHISSSIVRYTPVGMGAKESSIADLIEAVYKEDDLDSAKALRHNGIAVRNGFVDIANRHQYLGKILRGTDWSIKWDRTLLSIPKTIRKNSAYFGNLKLDAVGVPIELFVKDTQTKIDFFEEEIEF